MWLWLWLWLWEAVAMPQHTGVRRPHNRSNATTREMKKGKERQHWGSGLVRNSESKRLAQSWHDFAGWREKRSQQRRPRRRAQLRRQFYAATSDTTSLTQHREYQMGAALHCPSAARPHAMAAQWLPPRVDPSPQLASRARGTPGQVTRCPLANLAGSALQAAGKVEKRRCSGLTNPPAGLQP